MLALAPSFALASTAVYTVFTPEAQTFTTFSRADT